MVRLVSTGLVMAAGCAFVLGCEDSSLISVDGGTDEDSGTPPADGGEPGGTDTGTPSDTGMATDTGTPSDTAPVTTDLEIAGAYVSDFGEQIVITNASWVSESEWGSSSYTITQYDNEDDYLVAQNAPDDMFNPSLWSRFEWAVQGDLYYCQTLYAATSEAEAAAPGNLADKADIEAGCAGFPWTLLTPAEEFDAGPADDAGDPDAGDPDAGM